MTTGTYLEIDGRPALRFVRDYPHAQQRVWEAVTDPTELVAWFPARVAFPDHGAPAEGAAVRYSFGEDGDGGTGTVVTHDPPHRFTVTWRTTSCAWSSRPGTTAGAGSPSPPCSASATPPHGPLPGGRSVSRPSTRPWPGTRRRHPEGRARSGGATTTTTSRPGCPRARPCHRDEKTARGVTGPAPGSSCTPVTEEVPVRIVALPAARPVAPGCARTPR